MSTSVVARHTLAIRRARMLRAVDFKARLVRFGEDRSGDVAMLFGLMAIVMFLAIGAAVDVGRWLHARQQTIAAIDAAVLAGGRALQLDSSNTEAAIAAAERYYAANTATRLPLHTDNIDFSITDDGLAFTAGGSAYIDTPFLSLANINMLPLLKLSGSEYSKAVLAVGGNAGINLEISMMLDVTGSMSGSKIADLKIAAKDLLDIVVWEDQSEYYSKVAIVPFSDSVRLPSDANSAARGSLPSSKTVTYACKKFGQWTTCNKTYNLTSCVAERTGTEKYTDASPGSGAYVLGVYTTTGSCTQTADNELVPLSSDKDALKAVVDGLDVGGYTAGHLGTAWAWYTLSPNWNSLWSSASSYAATYGSADVQKIAILMTDGEYNTQYDANGIKTGSTGAGAAANGPSTTQARELCTAMKAAGITVYTVGFQLDSASATETLAQCATDSSKAFTAEDGDQLKQSFRNIALQISQLYLSK